MGRLMKDSGIPWIGEIPADWQVFKTKNLMQNKSKRGYPNEQVLSLYRDYGVIPKDSRNDNHNITSEDTGSYKLVDAGDFVINKMKAWQGSMGVSNYRGIISPAYYVCSFKKDGLYKGYIHYLLRNEAYKPEYRRLSTGMRVGQWDLNIDDFLSIPCILPSSISEQRKIADFLDRKCKEVDELIALEEKMIAELKAYKQSVITETVTKGLNPDVPMKDSGIEWIGQIPEHWGICKIQYLVDMRSGHNLTTEQIQPDGVYPVFGGNGIRGYYSQFEYEGNYVLVGRQGALCGNVNYANGKFWATEHAVVCHPRTQFNTIWFGEALRSMNLNQYSLSAAQPGLAIERIKTLPICLPTLDEQNQIANYLQKKCNEIDSLISIKQSKIAELQDYKKSIIYEYATGKKEVPTL